MMREMPAVELVIDHVTAAGSNLKVMQARLAAVGIRSEYGGPHSNHATEMASTSFPDGSYLELIAIPNGADPTAVAAHYWSKQMRGDAGPCAWAIRSKDLAADVARLKKAGVIVTDPAHSGRERPDGVRLDWQTANVGSEPNGTFFPFMIHDLSPREQRAFSSGKPTTQDFSSVSRVVIGVRDLAAATARYRKAFDLGSPQEHVDQALGGKVASFKSTPVMLAVPLNPQGWIAQRIAKFGEGPCAFVLRSARGPQKPQITWLDSDKLGWPLGVE